MLFRMIKNTTFDTAPHNLITIYQFGVSARNDEILINAYESKYIFIDNYKLKF